MVQGYLGSRKQVVQYAFFGPNLGNTNGTLFTDGTLGTQTYWMSRPGSIIGFSGSLNAALSTGTITAQVYIDGSAVPAFSNSAAVLHVNQQAGYITHHANKDNHIFVAGQSLGLRYKSSDTVTPLTTDGIFLVDVLLEDIDY